MNNLPIQPPQAGAKPRTPRIDNLRAVFIILVVFGHCLELTDSPLLYRVIYAFHMPAFIFLSGFCARGGVRRLLHTAGVYIVFQLLYRVFDALVLKGGAPISLDFATPYWILWYTMTTLWYMLLYPLLPRDHPPAMLGLIIASVIAALACGYAEPIGYFLSLSRTICFLPFFLGGVLCAHHAPLRNAVTHNPPHRRAALAITGALAGASVLFLALTPGVKRRMFYGSYSYAAEHYGPEIRLAILLMAAVFIALLLYAVPNRPIRVLTRLGQRTYPVYLLHGFILRLLRAIDFFRFPHAVNLLLCALVTLAILLLLARPAFFPGHSKAQP